MSTQFIKTPLSLLKLSLSPNLLSALILLGMTVNLPPAYSATPKTPVKPQQSAASATISKPTTTVSSPASRTVQIYLKNGDDLKGQIIAYQPNKLFIKTNNSVKALNLAYYHGLILDIPEEHTFGNSITHRPEVFESAIEYTKKIRPLLNKQLESNLKKLPNVCKATFYPMLHMQFDKTGKVTRSELLTRSNCPHLNLAMAQAVKEIKFPPLPKDYPINIYIFNYFFPVNQLQQPAAAAQPMKTETSPPAIQRPVPPIEAKPTKKITP